ncbi:hypothetical protein VE04_05232 [Pseudogymnoascus sp. 24MN13]|nr:hypothetical protein VE04_05232 [Pseudogymnoascus sp. 24MN13]
MSMAGTEPPEMSGALQENASMSRSSRGAIKSFTGNHSDLDSDGDESMSVYRREAGTGGRRGQSFFIVSDLKKHGEDRRGSLERIEIRPILKASTFQILKPRKKRRKLQNQYTIDAIRRHAIDGLFLEASIPLPESTSESSSGDESGPSYARDIKWKVRSSLDAIIREGNTSHDSKGLPTVEPSPRPLKYSDMISRASHVFRHFHKVLDGVPSRNNNIANITSIDFSGSFRYSPTEFIVDSNDSHNIRTLGAMGQIPENIKQRLLIVPDLAPQIINLLGNLFGLSPEVFEEHLINSGYEGANYDDKPAHTWSTAKMKKSHASIKWFRPVQRRPVAPYSTRDREILLDPTQGRLKRSGDYDRDPLVYQIQSNIFRSEWEMWTDPKITTEDERISGWEERATVWSQKLDGRDCHIVILILDPLPVIEEGAERVVEAARVYRPSKDDSDSDDSSFDPAEDAEHLSKLVEKLQTQRASKKRTTQLQKMLNPIGKDKKQDDEAASVLSQTYEKVKVKVLDLISVHPVFQQLVPRAHIEVGIDEAFRSAPLLDKLGRQLFNTTSTKDEFCQWLDSMPDPRGGDHHFALITPLYHIIQQDSTNLLSHLHKTLDEINVDMLSDEKMEDRVVMWRQIIARAQLELPQLKRSIATFFTFTQLLDVGGGFDVQNQFKELSTEIDDMIRRLQIASSSLTSNMALLDSRRSIAEAQAVTKLTELAFFFIPLSFTATLFGMQVEQLETRAPIWVFLLLGIGFIALSYLVRLTIRSAWLHRLIKAYKESIAMYAQNKREPLKQGNVPASMFVRWAGHMTTHGLAANFRKIVMWISSSRPGKIIIGASLVSLIAIPLAVIWTRPLAPGIKAAITVVIVLLVVIVVVLNVMWSNTPPHPNTIAAAPTPPLTAPYAKSPPILDAVAVATCCQSTEISTRMAAMKLAPSTSVVASSEAPTLKGFARLAHIARFDRLAHIVRNALYRLPPFAVHHVFMITISISIIFLSILVAGCTTTGLKDVYLLSLSYQPVAPYSPSPLQLSPSLSTTFANLAGNSTTLQVRAGYIGMCISAAPGDWSCSRDADSLARTLNGTESGSSSDPLNIIWIAKTFRDTIVFNGLMFVPSTSHPHFERLLTVIYRFASIALMVITLVLLVTYPQWHVSEDDDRSEAEEKPFPSLVTGSASCLYDASATAIPCAFVGDVENGAEGCRRHGGQRRRGGTRADRCRSAGLSWL